MTNHIYKKRSQPQNKGLTSLLLMAMLVSSC